MANKYMKRSSTSLVIRDHQIKTTINYFTPTKTAIIKKGGRLTNIGENTEKLEPSYIADENVKWCSHCGKVWQFLKRLNTALP